jgi:hypothetical protein
VRAHTQKHRHTHQLPPLRLGVVETSLFRSEGVAQPRLRAHAQ